MEKNIFAHSVLGKPTSYWQTLEDHLNGVASLCSSFAKKIKSEELGNLLGLSHDIGKESQDFQNYLLRENSLPCDFELANKYKSHAIPGARSISSLGLPGFATQILTNIICGHHMGLLNKTVSKKYKKDDPRFLLKYLDKNDYWEERDVKSSLSFAEKIKNIQDLPIKLEKGKRGFQSAFYTKMMYSCLVDADFLDTERFLDTKKYIKRAKYNTISKINKTFDDNMKSFIAKAKNTEINRYRNEMRCLVEDKANLPTGFFKLRSPTGGAKTYTVTSFALKHALHNNLERIIYCAPFTTIIEQNVKNIEKMIGRKDLIEHHSNSEFEYDEKHYRQKLDSENWDAPFVMTTVVQFFDSLFANKSSKSRKIHNIANSVIIFDEIQTIPPELLKPCLAVLNELQKNYNCSIVFCTASHPALDKDTLDFGIENAIELIEDYEKYFRLFKKRAEIKYVGVINDDTIQKEYIDKNNQILIILNSKRHVRELYKKAKEKNADGVYHLSAYMTPKHRSIKLQEIKDRLFLDKRCVVISTPLIEAGVDIDFPTVIRGICGIDNILQAAGRCNREGKRTGSITYVFTPDVMKYRNPVPDFSIRAEVALQIIQNEEDPYSQESIAKYFRLYYSKVKNKDKFDIMGMTDENKVLGKDGELNIQFEDIGRFSFISSPTRPVIIQFDDTSKNAVKTIKERIAKEESIGGLLRKLQRYMVQIYPQDFKKLTEIGSLEKIGREYNEVEVLKIEWTSLKYSDEIGLICDDETDEMMAI